MTGKKFLMRTKGIILTIVVVFSLFTVLCGLISEIVGAVNRQRYEDRLLAREAGNEAFRGADDETENNDLLYGGNAFAAEGEAIGEDRGEVTLEIVCGNYLAAGADETESEKITDEYLERFDSNVPEEYRGLIYDDEKMDSLIGPEAVIRQVVDTITGASGGVASFFAALLGCLALIALSEAGDGRLSDASGVGVCIAFGAAIAGIVVPIFTQVAEALVACSDFFAVLVPTATAIQVSSGAVNTASVSAVGMNLTVSVLGKLGAPFFLSLSGFGLCVGLLSSFGDGSTASLAAGVKKFFMWAIGLICAVLMGALSLQTFIASARDSAAMRAARYAATSLIPVVGGTVSGAMATLATGLSYVKNLVGVGALVIILSMLLSPLVILLLYRGAVSVASGLSGYLGVKRAESLFSSVRGAFDLYLAVYSISAVLFVFEIALFMMVDVRAT